MYMFSIFSGEMYSPWANLKMCFFLSIIFSVPFYMRKIRDEKKNKKQNQKQLLKESNPLTAVV